MALAHLLEPKEALPHGGLQQSALDLARALPRLAIDAKKIASALEHGLHGRRRAGAGESFWQFRNFTSGEAASRVDWRRSARDDRLYVREREWEAAHTVWLWCDRSPSMTYVSSMAQTSKIERGLVITLALADLLVRGGERVGLIGLAHPSASRSIVQRVANAWLAETKPAELPVATPLAPLVEAVLIGDFLSPAKSVIDTVTSLARRGARGHLVMIADPIEEIFPFQGRIELFHPTDQTRLVAGRVQSLRDDYIARLASHRDAIRDKLRSFGWTMIIHRTDRPASEALLALYPRVQGGGGV